MTRIHSVAASVTAWTVGAGAAVGVGLVALSLIGTGLANAPIQPLTPNGAAAPVVNPESSISVPASPSPTPSPTLAPIAVPTTPPAATTAPPADQTLGSAGGTVIVRCRSTGAYLVGWSPAPGFYAEDVVRGPAATVSLEFESSSVELELSIQCVYGVARATVVQEASGHGGGHG